MALDAGAPASWWLGPPAPRAITQLTRVLQLAVLGVMGAWVLGYLGGLRVTPRPSADGTANDTSQLFNWHPLLLTCAFPILMAEAVLAYKAPLFAMRDRCARLRKGGRQAGRRAGCAAPIHAADDCGGSSAAWIPVHSAVCQQLPLPHLPRQWRRRQQSKMYHFGLHSTALACTILGVIAAFKSHTLKRPAPMANL